MKLNTDFNYQDARAELGEILDWFEAGGVDVDEALVKYDRADILLQQIDAYLSDAKAKIELKIKANKA